MSLGKLTYNTHIVDTAPYSTKQRHYLVLKAYIITKKMTKISVK